MTPKFDVGEIVKATPEWATGFFGRVEKVGEVCGKNKKGEPVFETFSYIVRKGLSQENYICYFREAELENACEI